LDFSKDPTAPYQAVGKILLSTQPPKGIARAFSLLCEHFWPSMRGHSWWDGSATRCILASCAAAEVLRRLGLEATAASCSCHVLSADYFESRPMRTQGLTIGLPTEQHPGLHAALLVRNSQGSMFLVETSFFQAKRDRFPSFPDMILTELYPEGFTLLDGHYLEPNQENALLSAITLHGVCPAGDGMKAAWKARSGRPNWLDSPDASPPRSNAIADEFMRRAQKVITAKRRREPNFFSD